MSESAGLEARDLELWRGDRRLFTALSFTAARGQLVHVTGPNGVGKTSLLRVLCGLSTPETGAVRWNGVPIRAQPLGYHAQLSYLGHRDGLKNDLTGPENLRFALGQRVEMPEGAVTACLARLGLAAAAELPVRSLSAGQRRRVAIARCLLSNTPLWILDEPFSNLDSDGREWGEARLGEHLDEGGTAVVTSHHALHVPGHTALVVELR